MTQATPTAALFTPMGTSNTETPPSLPSTAPQPATSATPAAQPASKPPTQKHNPLHGITLEAMLTELVAHHGWEGLAQRIHIRCFAIDSSIKSSLSFLRKTPWAITISRDKSILAVKEAYKTNKLIGVVSQIDVSIEEPNFQDLIKIGTVAQILRMIKMPDGSTTAILQGRRRFEAWNCKLPIRT